jgi:hypothetical protein
MKKQIFTIIILFYFCNLLQGQYTFEATGTSNSLRLKTNTVDRLTITSAGSLGFGTTNPKARFHLSFASAGALPAVIPITTVGIIENNLEANLNFITPANQKAGVVFGSNSNIDLGWLKYDNSNNTMSFATNSTTQMSIKSGGRVGIGTTVPDFNLEVIGDADAGFGVTRYGGDSPGIFGRSAGGNISTPTATQLDHTLSIFGARGHDGTAFTSSRARIETKATQNWTTSANGTKMRFFTTPNGSTTSSEQMVIDHDGDVGINRPSPQAKLDIDGDIILGTLQKTSSLPNPNFNALDREGKSVIRFAGSNPMTLSGITGGVEGMILYIYCYENAPLTIQNEGAAAASQNQIWTGNSGNIVFTGRGGAVLVYDGLNQKWRVVSYNN